MAFHSVLKHGLSGEIPIVVLDSPETNRGLYVWLCVLICY